MTFSERIDIPVNEESAEQKQALTEEQREGIHQHISSIFNDVHDDPDPDQWLNLSQQTREEITRLSGEKNIFDRNTLRSANYREAVGIFMDGLLSFFDEKLLESYSSEDEFERLKKTAVTIYETFFSTPPLIAHDISIDKFAEYATKAKNSPVLGPHIAHNLSGELNYQISSSNNMPLLRKAREDTIASTINHIDAIGNVGRIAREYAHSYAVMEEVTTILRESKESSENTIVKYAAANTLRTVTGESVEEREMFTERNAPKNFYANELYLVKDSAYRAKFINKNRVGIFDNNNTLQFISDKFILSDLPEVSVLNAEEIRVLGQHLEHFDKFEGMSHGHGVHIRFLGSVSALISSRTDTELKDLLQSAQIPKEEQLLLAKLRDIEARYVESGQNYAQQQVVLMESHRQDLFEEVREFSKSTLSRLIAEEEQVFGAHIRDAEAILSVLENEQYGPAALEQLFDLESIIRLSTTNKEDLTSLFDTNSSRDESVNPDFFKLENAIKTLETERQRIAQKHTNKVQEYVSSLEEERKQSLGTLVEESFDDVNKAIHKLHEKSVEVMQDEKNTIHIHPIRAVAEDIYQNMGLSYDASELALYQALMRPSVINQINTDLAADITLLEIHEQIQLLRFLNQPEQYDKLKNSITTFMGDKIVALQAFLTVENNEDGAAILHIMDSYPTEVADKTFKHAALINQNLSNLQESIEKYSTEADIREQMAHGGAEKLSKNTRSFLNKASQTEPQEILLELEKIDHSMSLLTSLFPTYIELMKKEGQEVNFKNLEEVFSLTPKKPSEITNAEKEVMFAYYQENYANLPDKSVAEIIDNFKKVLDSDDKSTVLYLLNYKLLATNPSLAFIYFTELEDSQKINIPGLSRNSYVYAGGLNVRPGAKGARIGQALMEETLDILAQAKIIQAHTFINKSVALNYIGKRGFVGVSDGSKGEEGGVNMIYSKQLNDSLHYKSTERQNLVINDYLNNSGGESYAYVKKTGATIFKLESLEEIYQLDRLDPNRDPRLVLSNLFKDTIDEQDFFYVVYEPLPDEASLSHTNSN